MPTPIPRFMVRARQRREHEAHENARDPRRAERHRLDALMLDMHRQSVAARDAERVLEARRDPNAFAQYMLEGGDIEKPSAALRDFYRAADKDTAVMMAPVGHGMSRSFRDWRFREVIRRELSSAAKARQAGTFEHTGVATLLLVMRKPG